jgi:hypothetical protein
VEDQGISFTVRVDVFVDPKLFGKTAFLTTEPELHPVVLEQMTDFIEKEWVNRAPVGTYRICFTTGSLDSVSPISFKKSLPNESSSQLGDVLSRFFAPSAVQVLKSFVAMRQKVFSDTEFTELFDRLFLASLHREMRKGSLGNVAPGSIQLLVYSIDAELPEIDMTGEVLTYTCLKEGGLFTKVLHTLTRMWFKQIMREHELSLVRSFVIALRHVLGMIDPDQLKQLQDNFGIDSQEPGFQPKGHIVPEA